MTFVGLDLHKRDITACALDGSSTIVSEIRQLATSTETVLDWLAAVPAPVVIAMEATLYWEWLVARLQEAGHTTLVADAYQVKLIWQARSKTDIVDARKVAELLRSDLLPTIWVPISTHAGAGNSSAAARSWSGSARASRIAFTGISRRRTTASRTAICMARPGGRASRAWHSRPCSPPRRSGCCICTMC
jgi:hypothetical protein